MSKKVLIAVLVTIVVGVLDARTSAQVLTATFSGDGDSGGDCYDTMVAHDAPITGSYLLWGADRNYGGMTYIGANESAGAVAPEGQNTRTLIRFDVSALAGQFDSIESIELRLYQLEGAVTNISAYTISDANSNWQEGSDSGSYSSPAGWWNRTTWNNKLRHLTDSAWAGGPGLSVAGVDYDASPLASGTSSGSGWMSLELTGDLMALMEQWVQAPCTGTTFEGYNPGIFADPEEFTTVANEGLLLMADEGIKWSSSEGEFSPELVVRYIPEPATMSLLALGGLALLRRPKK
ncbi:MAG: PEP-CTERM sorting domain-containing protein [Planctomycetota bacterium]|jgi:hypothetical protein